MVIAESIVEEKQAEVAAVFEQTDIIGQPSPIGTCH